MENVEQGKQWFVLRDFKKWNAKSPAYKTLPEQGIRVFTPMHWVMTTQNEKRKREYVPVIRNLLFAYDTKETLEPIVSRDSSLQFQYMRGGASATPMIVPEPDMERFIKAVGEDPKPLYYTPEELTPDMFGKEIIVNGGPLDGYHGMLLKVRGTRKRRLIVEVPGFMAAAVEVNPDYIQLVPTTTTK